MARNPASLSCRLRRTSQRRRTADFFLADDGIDFVVLESLDDGFGGSQALFEFLIGGVERVHEASSDKRRARRTLGRSLRLPRTITRGRGATRIRAGVIRMLSLTAAASFSQRQWFQSCDDHSGVRDRGGADWRGACWELGPLPNDEEAEAVLVGSRAGPGFGLGMAHWAPRSGGRREGGAARDRRAIGTGRGIRCRGW